ncbi:hypothetical protein D9758_016578 [Tetrapyrgos nigripes]|uniref:Uncharacterized protein n=1 Tax=Tetrapyrgos nigripes TaxID=182062 RepID=A0A8H5C4F3_9AGAR|nr:hypothetical protein D9758_016578 [Tetrapyrgos nigripes]
MSPAVPGLLPLNDAPLVYLVSRILVPYPRCMLFLPTRNITPQKPLVFSRRPSPFLPAKMSHHGCISHNLEGVITLGKEIAESGEHDWRESDT